MAAASDTTFKPAISEPITRSATPSAEPAPWVATVTRMGAPSASACFSACGGYRWWLERRWDPERPPLLFIGLNPSRADGERDDPTLRRLQAFARAWGYGRLEVVNLFACIAASPALLRRRPDPVGPDNDRWLVERLAALQAEPGCCWERASGAGAAIWLGWGNGGAWRGRDREVLRLLQTSIRCEPASSAASRSDPSTLISRSVRADVSQARCPGPWPAAPPLLALGLTASGQPRHPLYVPGDAQPRPLLHPGAEFSVGTRP